jgi:hypothetical protein
MPIAWSYRVCDPSLLARKRPPSFVLGRWLAAFEGCVDSGAVAAAIGTCELSTIFTKRCLPHCGGQVARVAGTCNALMVEGLVDELAALAAKIPRTTGRPSCGRAAQFKAAD